MPAQRRRREIDQLRADQDALRAAAAWVREQPALGTVAVLSEPSVAAHCAALLDCFCEYCDRLDQASRTHVVRVARELLGDRMDQPTVRRTRRRR